MQPHVDAIIAGRESAKISSKTSLSVARCRWSVDRRCLGAMHVDGIGLAAGADGKFGVSPCGATPSLQPHLEIRTVEHDQKLCLGLFFSVMPGTGSSS